ncbi:hypothetical protein [Staphylococcus phage vB_SsapH-Golestan-100]|nr:hypothetical protein [Staphylococcus phage vB_SsapH-Golestan-100]
MIFCPMCQSKLANVTKDVTYNVCTSKDCRFCEITEPPNMMGDRPNTYKISLSKQVWEDVTSDIDLEDTGIDNYTELLEGAITKLLDASNPSSTFYQVEYFNRDPYTEYLEDERLVLRDSTIYSNKETLIKKLESQGFKYHTLDDLYSSNNLENPIAYFGAGNQVHAKIHKLTLESE